MSSTPSIILYVLVFACAFLALQAVLGTALEARQNNRHANKHSARQSNFETPQALLAKMRRDRGLSKDGYLRGLNYRISKAILQSGLKIGPYMIYPLMLLSGVVSAAIVYFFQRTLPHTIIAWVLGTALPLLVVSFFVKRRRQKAASQLPEALDVVIRSLKAGHPVPVALSLVGREMPDPIGSEFGMACDEIGYGGRVPDALQRIADRVGHEDFDLFSAMIRLQEKTGGNLAELLERNAQTIRSRQRMRLKIKAASAEGRVSAWILNLAPLLLFLIIKFTVPDFYGEVEDNVIVTYAFWGIGIWMVIGNMVMRRMINFKI